MPQAESMSATRNAWSWRAIRRDRVTAIMAGIADAVIAAVTLVPERIV
jgi:ABC-type amino acid transport substrate-binding protein